MTEHSNHARDTKVKALKPLLGQQTESAKAALAEALIHSAYLWGRPATLQAVVHWAGQPVPAWVPLP